MIPAVEFRSVSKSFGAVHANRDVSFSVRPGTIHGLVGENGAGKSTAMKILFGLEHHDSGELLVRGQTVRFRDARDAVEHGIGMVHQHFMLAEEMTVLENLILARPLPWWKPMSLREQRKFFENLAHEAGFEIDLDRRAGETSVGQQQRIEILKALVSNPAILILDEPSAVLTPQETVELFRRLRRLCESGKTILVITHKLNEIITWTDDVTVLRQGTRVASVPTRETDCDQLALWMIGRRDPPPPTETQIKPGEELLRLENFRTPEIDGRALGPLSLSVRAGEIVGVAGVEGNGQDILLRALAEPNRVPGTSGLAQFRGTDLRKHSNRSLRLEGAAFLPEDRLRQGVLKERTLEENFLLGHQFRPEYQRHGILRRDFIRQAGERLLQENDVQPPNLSARLGSLSGGNQQKLVVARELSTGPRFIVAAHPTRGVDLGAIARIHGQLRRLRNDGAGILVVSSELSELMQLCDRIHVLSRGKFNAVFEKSAFDETAIGAAMGGRGHA